MRTLYDWPSVIVPSATIVLAPSNTVDGSVSRSGFETNVPVAGSRNQMMMEFSALPEQHGHLFAWLCNQARGGLFLVPVWNSPQLARDAISDAADLAFARGLPFSTEERFSTGFGFRYQPSVDLIGDVLEGDTELQLDVSRHPTALTYGKVFGLGRSTYHVDDIEIEGNIATVTSRTPFRRDYSVALDSLVTLRPKMVCTPKDPSSFVGLFQVAQYVVPGSITMNEVIDERFL